VTLILGADKLDPSLTMAEAVQLIEEVHKHEAAGETLISPRQTTQTRAGWMRFMYAVDYATGFAAAKAFHLARGTGVRYVVLLYQLSDGEFLAILDGRWITDLRTGATSGVAARYMAPPDAHSVGILGSGHQARTQLQALATVLALRSARVYSPTREHRRAFAERFSRELDLAIEPVDSAEAAVLDQPIIVLATNALGEEPVMRAEWLAENVLVCAVGSTRPQSVEIDVATLQHARIVVVDTRNALHEAGDLRKAIGSGQIDPAQVLSLADIVASPPETSPTGITVFKSVGSALQDLAMAASYYERSASDGRQVGVSGLASLKRPASPPQDTGT